MVVGDSCDGAVSVASAVSAVFPDSTDSALSAECRSIVTSWSACLYLIFAEAFRGSLGG